MKARRIICAVAMLTIVAAAGTAAAHAFLQRAVPPVGSTVSTPPSEVRLWFTEPLEPAFSSVEVQDAAGKRVDQNDSAVETTDAKQLRIALPPLAAGTYKVIWRATSVDTHRTTGDFVFTVRP